MTEAVHEALEEAVESCLSPAAKVSEVDLEEPREGTFSVVVKPTLTEENLDPTTERRRVRAVRDSDKWRTEQL